MRHIEVKNSLTDYLEGELDLDRRSLVDTHLEACEDCSQELLELRHAVFLLRRLPTPESPPTLVGDVVRRIEDGEARPGPLFYVRRGWNAFLVALHPPGFTAPALGLAAGLAIVIAMGDYGLPGFGFSSGADLVEQKAKVEGVASVPSAQQAEPARRLNQQRQTRAAFTRNRIAKSENLDLRGSSLSQPVVRGGGSSVGVTMVSAGMGQPTSLPNSGKSGLRDADEWIEVLITRPADFAKEHSGLTELEQELWITHLGRRAEETGRLSAVVEALQTSRGRRAAAMAVAFLKVAPGDQP